METTVIVKCTCTHTFQDAKYGAGNRVANLSPKSGDAGSPAYRCTVCTKVHKK